jgi:hypothetical protein
MNGKSLRSASNNNADLAGSLRDAEKNDFDAGQDKMEGRDGGRGQAGEQS